MASQTNQEAKPSLAARGSNALKWAIGYNNNEMNRLGVPVVSSRDWLANIFGHPGSSAAHYFDSLFPFRKWIGSYNTQWLIGDIIAGITVALVVVPQSMSYAKLAGLNAEFGLYSSFVGVMIYAIFATSKDVTIGPVAVMSLQTFNVIQHVMRKTNAYNAHPEVIAIALAFLCGVICLGMGLLRIGFIIEFIPTPAVAGFMTGSAIQIAAGQVPKLLGLSAVNTNGNPAYRIIIDTLKGLPKTNINAAFGLPALFFLYFVKWFCGWLPKRYPRTARTMFFVSVLRNAFTIILFTVVSRIWLGTYPHNIKKYPISVLGPVPRGFKHVGQPNLSTQLLADIAPQLPVSVIILLLEHIAIAKSFGRLNNYKINPNQELIAIGVTNLIGPSFGAYAATGSFSRTAIKSKSGVRTPLAGWFTGILVLIAIYALSGTFYWIPNPVLSAVIIHAVTDLVVPFSVSYKFWLISPFELFIFLGAVFATVFSNTENGVYVSVAASLVLLLIRIARPRGRWLGLVRVQHGTSDPASSTVTLSHRDVFVPLDDKDGMRDPSIHVEAPPPGVLVYRFEEAFTYPNASQIADLLIDRVKEVTRPGRPASLNRLGDRPWNDPGPPNPALVKAARAVTCRSRKNVDADAQLDGTAYDRRPILRALIFDFSSVSHVDTTSVQTLVDVRTAVERYADAKVEFHFANVLSPWIRRGLLAGGFGLGFPSKRITEIAPVVSQSPNNVLSARELEEREKAEADRRAKAIERMSHKSANDGPAYPFSGRPTQPMTELEAGLAGDGAAASRSRVDLHDDEDPDRIRKVTIGEALYDVNTLDRNTPAASTPSHDSLEKSVEEGNHAAGRRTSEPSSISVPIIWGNDLTPYFHLDLSAALAAATESLGEDSQLSSSIDKNH
ncbi:STAS domain protein [Kalmanozyma brasiliensis GHG001]|uniref:Sulfate permease n=1 Tax=Kalmanozyma brasiliensis (strain GHG001) TaxID=1365824 RepID=V5E3T8_KALBG|nr:STAS domain protein [Kalmanozyma brasiliensis GHG001]EST04846.1 STAS domain protein [Kalmanozyma brasiliensis GHG001]